MTDTQGPKPKVDDQFWYDQSQEMVKTAVSRRNTAAEKLQTMIVWLWGIYTASATVGTALSKTYYSPLVISLIVSPIGLLIIAYWLAGKAQMPPLLQFAAMAPQSIKRAHNESIKGQSRWLTAAFALSITAAILVAVAISAASLSKEATPPKVTPPPNFQAYYYPKEECDVIALSGHFPAETKIVLRITPFPRPIIPDISKTKELLYVTLPTGELQASIELGFSSSKYEVTAEWEKDGLMYSLTRIVP